MKCSLYCFTFYFLPVLVVIYGVYRLTTHLGVHVSVSVINKEPLFFEFHGQLFPTGYYKAMKLHDMFKNGLVMILSSTAYPLKLPSSSVLCIMCVCFFSIHIFLSVYPVASWEPITVCLHLATGDGETARRSRLEEHIS